MAGVKDFLGNHCAAHSTPLKHEATDLQGQIEPLAPQESTTLEVGYKKREFMSVNFLFDGSDILPVRFDWQ